MIIIMMVILVLILLSLFLPFIDAATACIGGYEGPDANGLCTECPVGKASGDANWKFTVNSDKCVDVPTTCGPGQFIYAYSGGYFYCSNAYQGQYCPNGRCLVDSRNGYQSGANYCPGPYSDPRSDEILINDAEPSNNNFPDNVYVSPNPSNTPINAQYTYSEVVVYSSDSSLNTGGAIMCTEPNTDHCPPGTGNWGSGVDNGVPTSSPSYRSIITDNPNFLNSGVGQVGCYNCTAGTFQSGFVGTGRTFCQTCGPNQYSPARATSCTTNTCAAGYGYVAPSTHTYENELHACKACDAGYYNDGTFLACRQCPGEL